MLQLNICNTLPETNMAPENKPLGKGDSYWKPSFLGAMLVSGSVIHFEKELCPPFLPIF